MFFSLFYYRFILLLFPEKFSLWGAKVRIIFEITKNYEKIKCKNCDFLYFICNFAAVLGLSSEIYTIN